MRITVLGGGSSYTPELIHGFLQRIDSLPLSELWLVDIDAGRLELVGGFARRMVASRGCPFEVHLTTDRRQALAGASYAITQLRVGGMASRREDEYLGRRHGLVGQETTGAGGLANALRTIPVILEIARDLQDLAPRALLVNFSNPAGLVTEALARYAPDIQSVGVCNVPITTKMHILEALEVRCGAPVEPHRAHLDTLGLNHLSWHRGFSVDGQDLWPEILEAFLDRLRTEEEPAWDPCTIEALGMIPNDYLQYYYETQRKVSEQERWPPSRAEQVMAIEARLFGKYAKAKGDQLPEELLKRGGAHYSTVAAQLLDAQYNDRGEIHVANVRHQGAVDGWPPDWVLELPCRVDATGVHPLPARPLPTVCWGLLAQVKAYELLAVEAAVHGDRAAAHQALLAHPLGPPASRVQPVLDDLLVTHEAHLPLFWA
jgi:6-phospho-beta-glucosidase